LKKAYAFKIVCGLEKILRTKSSETNEDWGGIQQSSKKKVRQKQKSTVNTL